MGGEANKTKVVDFLAFLEAHLAQHEYLAGPFSVADITGLVALDFMKPAKLAIPEEFQHCPALACGAQAAAERHGLNRP